MSKIALEGNASGTGTFTVAAPNSNSNYTLTLPTSTGTVVVTGGAQTIEFAAGSASTPSITFTGDTNTGIFSPGADTIAFSEGGAEAMRIDSDGDVGIGTTSPSRRLTTQFDSATTYSSSDFDATSNQLFLRNANTTTNAFTGIYFGVGTNGEAAISSIRTGDGEAALAFGTRGGGSRLERMRIDSSGNVGIGKTPGTSILDIAGDGQSGANNVNITWSTTSSGYAPAVNLRKSNGSKASPTAVASGDQTGVLLFQGYDGSNYLATAYIESRVDGTPGTNDMPGRMVFFTTADGASSATERARIDSNGRFMVQMAGVSDTATGLKWETNGADSFLKCTHNSTTSGLSVGYFNRQNSDGNLVAFQQADTTEGTISVSGNTVSYNAFCGGHWSQLQEGRGYNPDIPRGTVMSSIGEMAEWKSVIWTETIEHPAIPAIEAKEAVLDEEGNVVEPAVEAVEGKDAWTESIPHREAYLGNLPIGATFEEDGFTKTVVDDGNERLPKVKISDVVGDKAVYGVFQTWDGVQDMLITSLGAFVVRIASGVTVQIGDLLESNGDGCAKVQDDDVIRSKTIGKVTSTVATATYPDGSYTVPCVIYCG